MSQPTDKIVSSPGSSAGRLALWSLLLAAVIVLVLYHYTLLAGSIAEIGGGGSSVFGVASIAASVIVTLEILTGWLFVESRGMTTLLAPAAARALLNTALKLVCVYLLYIFAIMETGLVLAADMLIESEATTLDFLAGQDVTARDDLMSQMTFVAKMAFAFASPFLMILAPLSVDRVLRVLRRQSV